MSFLSQRPAGDARVRTLAVAALALLAWIAVGARAAQVFAPDSVYVQPFIFCRIFRRATGVVWTDESVYLLQVAWLFIGIFAVAALGRRTRFVAPALFLSALCLHPTVSHYVFVLNQRYAWQLTPLLFAW